MIAAFDPAAKSLVPHALSGADVTYKLVAVSDDVQVGIGLATEQSTPVPGWYISMIWVHPKYQAAGHGFDLVSGLLRLMVDDGIETVRLVRNGNEGRVFQGGFGFVEESDLGAMKVYVASPPDPDWVRS